MKICLEYRFLVHNIFGIEGKKHVAINLCRFAGWKELEVSVVFQVYRVV